MAKNDTYVCIFCKEKQIKPKSHFFSYSKLPQFLAFDRFGLRSESIRAFVDIMNKKCGIAHKKYFECSFCHVFRLYNGPSSIVAHTHSCFVASKIYGFDDWFKVVERGKTHKQLAVDLAMPTIATIAENDKNYVQPFDHSGFLYMRVDQPVLPPPPEFGPPDLKPHPEYPNYDEFDEFVSYVPIPRIGPNRMITDAQYKLF